ncbi:MAG: hypothetical protein KDJ47_05790 [Hyphomicrobiaceae bacterium]|nr:hypothetical protein [Hyphomicrobiaceae bacterium]
MRRPRVRDRGVAANDPGRIRFTPMILPQYARRSRSLGVLIPVLCLKGISSDFEEALAALLGKDAPGLSALTISVLKEVRTDELTRKRKAPVLLLQRLHVRQLRARHAAKLLAPDGVGSVIVSCRPAGRRNIVARRQTDLNLAQKLMNILIAMTLLGPLFALLKNRYMMGWL